MEISATAIQPCASDVNHEITRVCQNKSWTEVIFNVPPIASSGQRIIFAGLYPPKKSLPDFQHANRTSQFVRSILGHGHFDWYDIFPYSPEEFSKDVDPNLLDKFLMEHHEYRLKWVERLEARIQENINVTGRALVYVCGKTCVEQFEESTLFPKFQKAIPSNPYIFTSSSLDTVIFFGMHPSAPLSGCGSKEFYRTLQRHLDYINLFFRGSTIASIEQDYDTNHPVESKIRNDIRDSFSSDQWNTVFAAHLAELPYEMFPVIRDHIKDCIRNNMTYLLEWRCFTLRLHDEEFWTNFCSWIRLHPNDLMCLLKKPHVVKRIASDSFHLCVDDLLYQVSYQSLLRLLSVRRFVGHLEDDIYMTEFSQCLDLYGELDTVRLFTSDYFLQHFETEWFRSVCHYLLGKYHCPQMVTLFRMKVFCENVIHPDYVTRLESLLDDLSSSRGMVFRFYRCEGFAIHAMSDDFVRLWKQAWNHPSLNLPILLHLCRNTHLNLDMNSIFMCRVMEIITKCPPQLSSQLLQCLSFLNNFLDAEYWTEFCNLTHWNDPSRRDYKTLIYYTDHTFAGKMDVSDMEDGEKKGKKNGNQKKPKLNRNQMISEITCITKDLTYEQTEALCMRNDGLWRKIAICDPNSNWLATREEIWLGRCSEEKDELKKKQLVFQLFCCPSFWTYESVPSYLQMWDYIYHLCDNNLKDTVDLCSCQNVNSRIMFPIYRSKDNNIIQRQFSNIPNLLGFLDIFKSLAEKARISQQEALQLFQCSSFMCRVDGVLKERFREVFFKSCQDPNVHKEWSMGRVNTVKLWSFGPFVCRVNHPKTRDIILDELENAKITNTLDAWVTAVLNREPEFTHTETDESDWRVVNTGAAKSRRDNSSDDVAHPAKRVKH